MFEVTLIDGEAASFSPDKNDKGVEMWGIEDPPGWVHVVSDGQVIYFPVSRVASVRVSFRPRVDEDVSAD